MPVIYRPIAGLEGKRIALCTTTGIATDEREAGKTAEAWHVPLFFHPHTQVCVPLHTDELCIIPWNSVSKAYRPYLPILRLAFEERVVSIHTHGFDPVNQIAMTRITDELAEPIQARIRRRLVYHHRVERCTAAAMALHSRLGDRSAMRVLGGDLMGIVASFI
jgi:hypothetical protein